VAALYKERKGEKKLSGCVRDQEYKAAPLSWNSFNKLKCMDANAATKERKQAMHDALSRLRLPVVSAGVRLTPGRLFALKLIKTIPKV
jgi:hypothetical protein